MRTWRWIGLIAGLAVGVSAVVLGANLLRGQPAPSFSMARPNPGQVRPDHLADGTPVFVVGHADGSVGVVSAFDTHTPYHLGKLNWWCSTASAFDNPSHGSRWDEYGNRIGGPAPLGLVTHEVEVQGGRVLVGAARPGAPPDAPHAGEIEGNRDWCLLPDDADDVIYHRFGDWQVWDSPVEAVRDAPADRWILLQGELVAVAGEGGVRVCAIDGCEDSAIAANVERPDRDVPFGPLGPGRFIARVRDGVLVDVTRAVVLANAAP